jgi:hypothetical protein
MGIFDWIPTVGEVLTGSMCLAMDHDWTEWVNIGNNVLVRECQTCGKIEKKKI